VQRQLSWMMSLAEKALSDATPCEDIGVTVVLVHGNPETDAVWGPLVDALGRTDVVRLSPPGFGAPLPSGFPATFLAYRDWLVEELEKIGQAVDLV
jgi:pimeloyl-ACP methyl ester carboxylesterase